MDRYALVKEKLKEMGMSYPIMVHPTATATGEAGKDIEVAEDVKPEP